MIRSVRRRAASNMSVSAAALLACLWAGEALAETVMVDKPPARPARSPDRPGARAMMLRPAPVPTATRQIPPTPAPVMAVRDFPSWRPFKAGMADRVGLRPRQRRPPYRREAQAPSPTPMLETAAPAAKAA
jgi:hypothetical protein